MSSVPLKCLQTGVGFQNQHSGSHSIDLDCIAILAVLVVPAIVSSVSLKGLQTGVGVQNQARKLKRTAV